MNSRSVPSSRAAPRVHLLPPVRRSTLWALPLGTRRHLAHSLKLHLHPSNRPAFPPMLIQVHHTEHCPAPFLDGHWRTSLRLLLPTTECSTDPPRTLIWRTIGGVVAPVLLGMSQRSCLRVDERCPLPMWSGRSASCLVSPNSSRKLRLIRLGLDGRTTVMVKDVPVRQVAYFAVQN